MFQSQASLVMGAAIVSGLFIGAVLLARRNLRLGRCDRRAAFRLSLFVLLTGAVPFVFGTHHVATVQEASLLLTAAAEYLSYAGALWLAYTAIEPLVRRRWPDLIISSTRLLAGRVADPLVGRDILVGSVAGIASIGVLGLILRIGLAREWPGARGSDFQGDTLAGQAVAVSALVAPCLLNAISLGAGREYCSC